MKDFDYIKHTRWTSQQIKSNDRRMIINEGDNVLIIFPYVNNTQMENFDDLISRKKVQISAC